MGLAKDIDVSASASALPPGRSLRLMIVSDLDHTMVQNEDTTHANLLAFNKLWMTRLEHDGLLVYSTGRSPELFNKLWLDVPLLTPNVLICSVGSEIFYLDPVLGTYRPDLTWSEHLDEGGAWNREQVAAAVHLFPQLQLQAATEQRRHKVSFLLKAGSAQEKQEVVDALSAALVAANLPAKVIFSGGEDVDVLSRHAGKGGALQFLLNVLRDANQWPARGVLVCGDSGNDVELLAVPDVLACAMAKSHEELVKWVEANQGPNLFQATEMCAGGIVEAMRHYHCLPDQPKKGRYNAPPTIQPQASGEMADQGSEGLYMKAWELGYNVMGGEHEAACWIDLLRITGGSDGRWIVKCTTNRLNPDGTRDAAHSRDCTAVVARNVDGTFEVEDLETVVPPVPRSPSFVA